MRCPGAGPRLQSQAVQPATTTGILTGELAGGIMTKQAAQRAWRHAVGERSGGAVACAYGTMFRAQRQRRVLGESDATMSNSGEKQRHRHDTLRPDEPDNT
jgi:hypothetical protein